MKFESTMTESYWLTEYQKDISKLNTQISYFKDLIESENNQPNPRLKKLYRWNNDIKDIQYKIDSRINALAKINNK
tara:strand:- start:264 stop:491 length:228 start_codon:yes stop_codon:yes gene_type:complete